MQEASITAQEYASSVNTTSISIEGYEKYVSMAKVSTLAQNKSLSNTRLLLNEYNSGMTNCGLSQEDFISSVNKSNSTLGKYLSGLNGAKGSMSGYITSLVGAKAASIALQVATMALNTALTMGIAWAIGQIVSGLNDYIHSAENASEAADELANSQRQSLDDKIQEQKQLVDLIEQYKNLRTSENMDKETRSQVMDIQSQITDLVGEQAKNLDLVNGKLDEEINKLNLAASLEAADTAEKAKQNYISARNSSKKAQSEDYNGFYDFDSFKISNNVYNFLKNNKGKDFYKYIYGSPSGGGLFNGKSFTGTIAGNNASEKMNNLNEVIKILESQLKDYQDDDFYNKLISIRDDFEKYDEKQSSATNDLLKSTIVDLSYNNDKLKKITVDSVDSFEEYRNTLINELKSNDGIGIALKDGNLDDNAIIEYVNQYMSTLDGFSDYYNDWKNKFSSDTGEVKDTIIQNAQSIEDTVENVKTLVGGINNVNSIINEQTTGKSISVENFNSDELSDYKSALEYVNGTLQLNKDKVKELTKAKVEEQIATNNAIKAQEESKYLENAQQIEILKKKIKEKNFEEGENVNTVQATIDSLIDANFEIMNQCDNLDVLNSSLSESIGLYQEWKDAQNSSESGDMFDDTLTAIKMINDTLNNTEFENFGKIGREDYKTSLDLIIPSTIDSSDKNTINSYLDSISDMFTFDDDGNRIGLNIENFCQDAVDKGLMTIDKASDSYVIAGGKTMENFAEGLNLSLPLVQAMFGEMEEYGGEFDWGDEVYKTIGDGIVSCTEEISNLESQIDELNQQKELGIDVDDSQVEEANKKLNELKKKKSELTEKAIVNIESNIDLDEKIKKTKDDVEGWKTSLESDPTNVEVKTNLSDAEEKLEKLQKKKDKLQEPTQVEITAALGSLDSQISNIKTQLDNLKDKNYLIKYHISESDAQTKISDLEGQLDSLNEKKAKIETISNSDEVSTELDKLNKKEIDNKTFKINIVDNATKTLQNIQNYELNDKTVKVNVKKTTTEENKSKVNGTANVNGTAFVQGTWGNQNSGETLVGELGREIVVNPYTGKWYTVGDNGAEFVNLPKNAIVFNHLQSEALLNDKFVASRGSSLAMGNALVHGNAMVTGGIKRTQATTSTQKTSNSKSNSNSSSKSKSSSSGKKSSSSSKSKSEKNGKELADTIDWIEVAIERIETAIDNLDRKASSVYNKFSTRNKTLTKEIKKVRKEIDLQSKGAKRYEKQAKSVATKTGLSKSWQKKVQKGKIDIDTISDSKKTSKGYSLKSAIEDYQTWTNKTKDCKTAMKELKETVKELYKIAFDNTVTKYEEKLAKFEHRANILNTKISKAESKGYADSTIYYTSLISNEADNLKTLQEERKALQKKLDTAVNKGKIKKGSEAYNEMQQEIWGVDEAIEESKANTAEWNAQIRQIKWDRFDALRDAISKINDEAEFLINLLSSKDLFSDNGQLTNNGLATMGLYAQSYNVDMEQTIQYAKERVNIEKELSKNPYDTKLIERRNELIKLEQESISSAEDNRKAIVDLVEQGINKELDALKELIDTYTDALDAQKDLFDYQKKVSSQSKDIAKIQKQLSAYANDTSEESRAKIQELKESLSKAQEDLEETQYDQYITDQKNLLSNLYDDYEEILNQRLDNVDQLINDMINTVNDNSSTINKTIKDAANTVGYTLTNAITTVWKSPNAVKDYNGGTDVTKTNTYSAIKDTKGEIQTAQSAADNNAKDSTNSNSNNKKYSKAIKEKVEKVFGDSKYYKKGTKKKASDYGTSINQFLFGKNGKVLTSDGLVQIRSILGVKNGKILEELQYISKTYGQIKNVKGLKTGTYNLGSSQYAWTQESYNPEVIIRPSDGAILTPLAKGDSVLNANATANLWDMANDPAQFIKDNLLGTSTVPNVISNGNNNTIKDNNIEVVMTFPNVKNYEGFMQKMQNDPRFEEMIQDMSVNLLAGGSSLSKYSHKF